VVIDGICTVLGHPKRREAFASYTLGLLSDLERKSVEPIAALGVCQRSKSPARSADP
jgi:SRSO17 transposase